MMGEETAFLRPEDGYIIAQWAVMTSMTMERANDGIQIVPPVEREKLAADQIISPGWQVYIGRSSRPPTRDTHNIPFGI